MPLLSEMRKLTLNLLGAYDARMAEVASLRSDTREELADFRAAHQAMSTEQQQRLDEQMDALHTQVTGLRQTAAAFLGEVDEANQAMAQTQQQQLTEGRAGLTADTAAFRKELDATHQAMAQAQQQQLSVYRDELQRQTADLRRSAGTFVDDLDAANQAMAQAQQQRLAEERARLAADTAAFRAALADAHQTMAAGQEQTLHAHRDSLRRQVSQMRQEGAAFVRDVHAAHQAMADQQRKNRANAWRRLASDTASMRRGFQAELSAVRADQRGGRLVWQALAGLKQQHRMKRPVAIARPTGETTVAKAPPAPEPGGGLDELRTISGVGASMEQRLHQAGIRTFAQLAASTPEALREALGPAGRLAKVEAWIAQARELSG